MLSIFKNIKIEDTSNICLSGLTDELFCVYVMKLFSQTNKNIIIVTPTLYEANKLYISFQNYNRNVLLFPEDDFLMNQSFAISPELENSRIETLKSLNKDNKYIIVTHLMGYIKYLPAQNKFNDSIIKLKVGYKIPREELIEKLYSMGYIRESIVTNTGEIGIRGFVIDIFPISFEHPIRIELFGDEISSIRLFDEETQKSIETLKESIIYPNKINLYDEHNTNISDYLNNPITIVKDMPQLKKTYDKLLNDIFEYNCSKNIGNKEYYFNLYNILPKELIYYNTIDNISYDKTIKNIVFDSKKIDKFNENIDRIQEYIKKMLFKKYTIIVCLKTHQVNSFKSNIKISSILTNENNLYDNKVNIIVKDIQEGFIYQKYVVLTYNELFSKKYISSKYKSKLKYTTKIKNISTIEIGDYVVHSLNGIGVYNGIRMLTKNGVKRDYLEVLYAGHDKLYVPVEKIDYLSKYSGKEGIQPKIYKLGSSEWQKNKLRVRNRIHDIAKQLLELYAKRSMKQGFKFLKDDEMQTMFENEFEHVLTKDQESAIIQIKSDMESTVPMDRLLCGDVGYGKTEVAFRAMFKAVLSSKQVFYLCPTTILSKQQYENAKERFKNYPVNIEVLNRFTTKREVNRIINGIKDGRIDIVFGTHRILSNDIFPKKLGLLIIDEEQRFGVIHKEKIKKYKENIDVLTLTATPIPRTLQMSLVGIRGLSLIETPPQDRYPVQTYVLEENEQIIRDAIYKEMGRNGQVFVLFNRVEYIEQKSQEIQKLVPDAKIVTAHGQMNKSELEDKMIQFVEGKYDVMICTTIIETGMDIPNVNTMIIIDSDKFGLSQLYQLRGRVGRTNKIAYAYLMYSPKKMLNDIAIKRLDTIKEFTELGSGFAIANRDLSIRGAGDILGSEQAGFIDSVGINLYLKILNDEVRRLKGEVVEEDIEYNAQTLLEVDTHVEDTYVEDSDLKIEIHKKVNEIDSYNKLLTIKEEIEDRFGKIDKNLEIYMYEEWFEKMAKTYSIIRANKNRFSIELTFDKNISDRINGEKMFIDATNISKNFNFSYKNNFLSIIFNLDNLDKHYIYYICDFLSKLELTSLD